MIAITQVKPSMLPAVGPVAYTRLLRSGWTTPAARPTHVIVPPPPTSPTHKVHLEVTADAEIDAPCARSKVRCIVRRDGETIFSRSSVKQRHSYSSKREQRRHRHNRCARLRCFVAALHGHTRVGLLHLDHFARCRISSRSSTSLNRYSGGFRLRRIVDPIRADKSP